MPDYPIHFDFEYVTKNIEKGLLDLGCKQVKVFIGPKTFTELERVGHWEKHFFSQMKKYVYETRESEKTVIKWIISISW